MVKFWNNLSLVLCLMFYGVVQSQQPFGYIGCYEKSTFGKNITTAVTREIHGTYCIDVCKTLMYRYAGTQGIHCKCGHTIRSHSKRTDCTFVCAGLRNEFCGGLESMSVYDISIKTQPETITTPRTTTTTTASTISTVTIKEFTEPTNPDLITVTTLPETTVTPSSTPTTVTIMSTDTINDFTDQTTGDQTNKETEKVGIQSATSLQISAKATVEIINMSTDRIRKQTSISIMEPKSTNTVLSTAMNTIPLTTDTTKLANSGSTAIYILVSVISVVLIDVTAIVIVCRWRKQRLPKDKYVHSETVSNQCALYDVVSLKEDVDFGNVQWEETSAYGYSKVNIRSTKRVESDDSVELHQESSFSTLPGYSNVNHIFQNTEYASPDYANTYIADDLAYGRYWTGTTDTCGMYDTIRSNTKTKNIIKMTDCCKPAYDHMLFGNQGEKD
ncbi:uncharacterized protein LOC123540915 [Mercenaria mercenaria]|uniref:uncharacterized protein LOC123540915 n=1 Tax=Mercenaria mercenaria TaxID=6596 RepID=UPI00234ED7DB|nr:uncharacterized protein LOC123540915 [Mercenaria mercenaria]